MPARNAKSNDAENEKFKAQLARRIKSLRLKTGENSAEVFAFKNKISRSQYASYEKGVDIRYTSLVKLVKKFNTTLSEFFSEGFDD